jgi:CRP-like cAMP-binding protein
MSTLSPTSAQLQKFALFSDLSLEECGTLASCFQLQEYAAGTELIQQDDLSVNLYLIVEGIVEVSLPLVGVTTSTRIAKFGPGECVGELALARVARRAASAVVKLKSQCLTANASELTEICAQHPRIGFAVYKKLSEIITDRLVSTNMQLRNSESHANRS